MSNPLVTFEMDSGKVMKAELYPEIAPNTVNNFISLVNKGFYDGLIFHRVISGFMIQGGDPLGKGIGGPGYSIKGEFTSNGFKNPLLHERAFGKLIEGLDVLDEIASVRTDYNDKPRIPQVMKKVTVETFGTEYPAPVTI